MKKKILIPIIIIASCTIGIGGYSIYNSSKLTPKVTTPLAQVTPKTPVVITPTQTKKNESKEIEKIFTPKVEKPIAKTIEKPQITTNEKSEIKTSKSISSIEQPQPQKTKIKHEADTEESHINKSTQNTIKINNPKATTHRETKKPTEIKHTEVDKPLVTEHTEHKTSDHKEESAKPIKHINITNEYLNSKFEGSHPNSIYNDVRRSMYYEVLNALGSSAWDNNSVQVNLLNKVNNISDNKLRSITPKSVDPTFATVLINYYSNPTLPITINVNGVPKTVDVALDSMG
ncbi:hypothetical protein [uncultured Clostridium sp.]|jgi:hypothetical protein|uniref:hypothetical protein n=1 Tax=uncultured Clostridium sp. TaxID=59620 RepID=UPI0026065E05|nr:hypothetical protein [uncultured Clostridium sp.]